jgi:hypothetical protein
MLPAMLIRLAAFLLGAAVSVVVGVLGGGFVLGHRDRHRGCDHLALVG